MFYINDNLKEKPFSTMGSNLYLIASVIFGITMLPHGSCSDVCLPDAYNETATGTDLWCYDCAEIYTKKYKPHDSPCINNITQIALRQCGPRDTYCKVERRSLNGQTLNIERGCVESCYYGCRFNGFGLTYMKCTSCCRTPGCNDGNNAIATTLQFYIIVVSVIVSLFISRL